MREKKLVLALAVLAAAVGCSTWQAKDESPAVSYYAALADYVQLKGAAAVYAEAPSTPASEVEQILQVVTAADGAIAAIEAQRSAEVGADQYAAAALLVRAANARLAQILANGGVR